ncbi:MAG: tRNA (guanosine(46)-N7)-methyltransferase TrmB [Verrucomicrobiae bacterium]|nr:tRNA (guanosine(46)-N7)-methyltransferase TrmB [Verrucomicrobiae bacterium]
MIQANLFIEPADWFAELRWAEWFPKSQPVHVDLGAGDGGFAVARAQAHPEWNFIAVERLLGRARKIDKRGRRLELSNLRVLRMETLYAVRRLFAAGSVEAFYLLFPDPWPKKKHHRRRIIRGEFLDGIERALKSGGTLYCATDHADYFQEMEETMRARAGWATRKISDDEGFAERTDFERQFLAEGRTIGRLECRWHSDATSV